MSESENPPPSARRTGDTRLTHWDHDSDTSWYRAAQGLLSPFPRLSPPSAVETPCRHCPAALTRPYSNKSLPQEKDEEPAPCRWKQRTMHARFICAMQQSQTTNSASLPAALLLPASAFALPLAFPARPPATRPATPDETTLAAPTCHRGSKRVVY